jgi:hypothetical protein
MNSIHLTTFLQSLKTDILNSLQSKGKNATGQTAQQIQIITDEDKALLQIPGYLQILETGRKPTSKNASPGNPPMIQRIADWCRAKGIPDKAIWAVKKSINKKGFKGTPGILSEPLSDDNINQRLTPVLEDIATETATQIAGNLYI